MAIRRALGIVSLFIVTCAAAGAWAVSSSLWEIQSKEDFDAGEPDGVSVMPPGKVMLGPKKAVTLLDALYAWALALDSRGNVYTGTGNDGRIFKIPPRGEAEVFADLELQQVFALAIDKSDTLYAAGFPGGKIFSITSRGEIAEIFNTEQDSIWSLNLAGNGTLFAGTGNEGLIFRIEPSGKGGVLYDSPERRILSLISDAEGNLYAGTEQSGIVYKIDPSGHPFIFYDTELEEVTSMTIGAGGNLYVLSSPGSLFMKIPPPQAVPVAPKPAQEAVPQNTVEVKPSMGGPGVPAVPSPKKRTCIIYEITRDGTARKFWESPEQLIFSIVFDGKNILAGSGDDGLIYLVSPTGDSGIYYQADQKQVLDLYRSADGVLIASLGNNAAIVRFEGGYSPNGAYISQVHDATTVSRWGKVFWEADVPTQTRISLATRSGNSETPDDTWSEWSEERTNEKGFVSSSPNARYIQWRATLSSSNSGKTPSLHKATVAYLQANLAPQIQSVSVGVSPGNGKEGNSAANMAKALKALSSKGPSGIGLEEAGKSKASKDGVKAPPAVHDAKLQIQWQALDENGDTLQYTLNFKGTGETRWKLLDDELSETTYEWNTEAVPDGEYHIKVVASDSPSNTEESSLEAERVSEPFMVDNTAPVVNKMRAISSSEQGTYRITGTVSDHLSPVRSAHYSVNAGDWRTVFPKDGIFDSLSEEIEFTTGKLEEGEHTVVLKVADYFGNVGAGKITFVAK